MKIKDIEIPAVRKRAIDPKRVASLAESMKAIGQLQPVVVTRGAVLVFGLHRLEAAKSLGWTEVDVSVRDFDDLQAELAEIDENLIRNELTVLERDDHIRRRKELYESLYPHTRHGAMGALARNDPSKFEVLKDRPAFHEDMAAKTGLSKSSISNAVRRSVKIAPDVKAAISGTALADSQVDLEALAHMPEERQRETIKPVLEGKAETVRPKRERDLVSEALALVARMTPEQRNEFIAALQLVAAPPRRRP